ncbi:MAG: glycine/betaine ABC transporter substrate-binding protein [Oscillospiraceae bacterium]|nr:glycine/betaine ABC transporter substrate-binding protein [Oscillospiraceae bacterium]
MKKIGVLLTILILLLTMTGCASRPDADAIRVGSKDFTESFILAELYALALEEAGLTVDRRFNLGGTGVVHAAIQSGDLDLYPEYTGTAFLNVLQLDLITDPDVIYQTVKAEYEARFGLTLLNAAEASNSQGLAITREASLRYGITTISDLQANAEHITFASLGEFSVNPDGLPALVAVYGPFRFRSVIYIDNSIKYEVLRMGQADLTVAFTTDGQLLDEAFVLLEDDQRAWPAYNIVPIVRMDLLERHPEIADILNTLSAHLDNPTMQMLNAQVDIENRDPSHVARDFFATLR